MLNKEPKAVRHSCRFFKWGVMSKDYATLAHKQLELIVQRNDRFSLTYVCVDTHSGQYVANHA